MKERGDQKFGCFDTDIYAWPLTAVIPLIVGIVLVAIILLTLVLGLYGSCCLKRVKSGPGYAWNHLLSHGVYHVQKPGTLSKEANEAPASAITYNWQTPFTTTSNIHQSEPEPEPAPEPVTLPPPVPPHCPALALDLSVQKPVQNGILKNGGSALSPCYVHIHDEFNLPQVQPNRHPDPELVQKIIGMNLPSYVQEQKCKNPALKSCCTASENQVEVEPEPEFVQEIIDVNLPSYGQKLKNAALLTCQVDSKLPEIKPLTPNSDSDLNPAAQNFATISPPRSNGKLHFPRIQPAPSPVSVRYNSSNGAPYLVHVHGNRRNSPVLNQHYSRRRPSTMVLDGSGTKIDISPRISCYTTLPRSPTRSNDMF